VPPPAHHARARPPGIIPGNFAPFCISFFIH